ncbi:MAG TPA: KTSC domain-containing protein [Terriglobia bacterium]|nr:KTSC domain-containing protein [Terriglobia bacterium]
MVFCPECNAKVDDCKHFVSPLDSPSVEVFDPKIRSLAYEKDGGVLEIRFKNGQAWQLFGVSPDIYDELLHQTLSSFLKFIGRRYKPRPVRGVSKPIAPKDESCPACHRPMVNKHQTSGRPMRILWHCNRCNQSFWRSYATESVRERRPRFH